MLKHTDFLFAEPSFLEGVARVVDLGNTLSHHNISSNGRSADEQAIHSDYSAIGRDMRAAMVQTAFGGNSSLAKKKEVEAKLAKEAKHVREITQEWEKWCESRSNTNSRTGLDEREPAELGSE